MKRVISILLIGVFILGAFGGCANIENEAEEITTNVSEDNRNRVIYVYSDDCAACQKQEPIFQDISLDEDIMEDYLFTKVDIQDFNNTNIIDFLGKMKKIEGTPMIYILSEKGDLLDTHVGFLEKDKYIELLNQHTD